MRHERDQVRYNTVRYRAYSSNLFKACSIHALHRRILSCSQEEAEVTEALYHMNAGENLLRQKEERLRMLENSFANDLVSYSFTFTLLLRILFACECQTNVK